MVRAVSKARQKYPCRSGPGPGYKFNVGEQNDFGNQEDTNHDLMRMTKMDTEQNAISINQSFFQSLDQIIINFNQLQDQIQNSKHQKTIYEIPSEIQLELLPNIKHQLTSISILIKPTDLLKSNHHSNQFHDVLNLFHQFQSKIQSICNLIQLQNQSSIINPSNLLITIGKTKFKEIYNRIDHLLTISIDLTNAYQTYFSSTKDLNQIESNRKIILQKTSQAWQLIDQIIESFYKSDLEFLRDRAKDSVEVIEDALEEVRTLLERTEESGLEDRLDGLDLNLNPTHPHESQSFEMFLGSAEDQVKLTEAERSRVNLSIPVIRLCRVLSLRLVNPTKPNMNLLKSIRLETLEKMVNTIERFPEHIDELVSELDTSPHSKPSISKALDGLSVDCNLLVDALKGDGDGVGLDSKEVKWFEIWTNQMEKASAALLREFDRN